MIITSFFVLYTLLHVYFFLKFKAAIKSMAVPSSLLWLFFLFMILTPIFVHLLEKGNSERAASIYAYIGYTWMAFIFLFFFLSVGLEVFHFIFRLFSKANFLRMRMWLFLVSCFASVLCVAYGFFEAKKVKIENIIIKTDKLPRGLNNLRIVQITDLHLGLLTKEDDVKKYIEKIALLRPDILVCTGDLVDSGSGRIEKITDLLKLLNVPLGKFAVFGNHEYYAGTEHSKEIFISSGFRVLKNEVYIIKNGIAIVGIDDASSYDGVEVSLLKKVKNENLVILLKHRPVLFEETFGLFDIALFGHTHGGQIFPFRLITRLFFKYVSGHKILPANSHLYISRGLGTWGPPIRFLSPPEITVITIHSKTS